MCKKKILQLNGKGTNAQTTTIPKAMKVSPRILRPENSSHSISEKETRELGQAGVWNYQPQTCSPPNTEAASIKA